MRILALDLGWSTATASRVQALGAAMGNVGVGIAIGIVVGAAIGVALSTAKHKDA